MQTKYRGRIWLISLVVLVAIFSLLLSAGKSKGVPPQPIEVNSGQSSYLALGGDCSADRATGDLYYTPDGYCLNSQGTYLGYSWDTLWTKIAEVTRTAVATLTPTKKPHQKPTNTPTATVTTTSTVRPTETSTKIPPTITGTPSPEPTEETSTPEVTEKPPKPTEEVTETPCPTEKPKECKNKNDDKKPGENPTDCNAGWGNG
jgi:hypothetical protein